MTEVVVMLSFVAYLLRLKIIIALAPFHQEFELTSFQCQLTGPNKLSLLMDLISCDVEACIPVSKNIDYCRGRRGRDPVVVGLKTTDASIAYRH